MGKEWTAKECEIFIKVNGITPDLISSLESEFAVGDIISAVMKDVTVTPSEGAVDQTNYLGKDANNFQNAKLTEKPFGQVKATVTGTLDSVNKIVTYFDNSPVLSIITGKVISNVTLVGTDPVLVTATTHGFSTGNSVGIIQVVGTTQLNNHVYVITKVNDNSFTLDGTNSSLFSAYISDGLCGTVIYRKYQAGQSVRDNIAFGVKLEDSDEYVFLLLNNAKMTKIGDKKQNGADGVWEYEFEVVCNPKNYYEEYLEA